MRRATQAELQERYAAILAFCEEQHPVTVRGIYYHLTTRDLVPKTDAGYQRVAKSCKKLRLDGELPFEYIADNTRWCRVPRTFNSIEDALANTARTYRRDMLTYAGQDIEIWCEKDALAGVFYEVTSKWDVPLMVSRGFSSLSFLHNAAQTLQNGAFVYIFSDYDAAGETIYRKIVEGLHEFSGRKRFEVNRAMLTQEHVEIYNLPTREPKASDRRQGYTECAELDAVLPSTLREEVEMCITQHINTDELALLRAIEADERASISEIFNYTL